MKKEIGGDGEKNIIVKDIENSISNGGLNYDSVEELKIECRHEIRKSETFLVKDISENIVKFWKQNFLMNAFFQVRN